METLSILAVNFGAILLCYCMGKYDGAKLMKKFMEQKQSETFYDDRDCRCGHGCYMHEKNADGWGECKARTDKLSPMYKDVYEICRCQAYVATSAIV